MPKPLRQAPPSSSVAHLFDMQAAARAVATAPAETRSVAEPAHEPRTDNLPRTIEPMSPPAIQARAVWGERPIVKRELVLTASTDEALTQLVELYRRSTGT